MVDLNELDREIDALLARETVESLINWMDCQSELLNKKICRNIFSVKKNTRTPQERNSK